MAFLKSCAVPKCENKTTNTPEKLFFPFPKNALMRKRWRVAMKMFVPFGDKSKAFCCEDHFDIATDVENYGNYRLVGENIKLKKGIIPHKFECQLDNEDKPERFPGQGKNYLQRTYMDTYLEFLRGRMKK